MQTVADGVQDQVREAYKVSLTGPHWPAVQWCLANLRSEDWLYYVNSSGATTVTHVTFFRQTDYMMFMMVWG